jgi:tRNA-splicing ligase RtcB (3'-phosphate/5'-hydroxy nucleic acid ligase)
MPYNPRFALEGIGNHRGVTHELQARAAPFCRMNGLRVDAWNYPDPGRRHQSGAEPVWCPATACGLAEESVMEYTEPSYKVPVKSWLPIEEIEDSAMQQIRNAALHPEVVEHIAVMPDCHVGYGIPVGSIFVTEASVVPNAVGVDIGCGVAAYPTNLAFDSGKMDRDYWRNWAGHVQRNIPHGFNQFKVTQEMGVLNRALKARKLQTLLAGKAPLQLGTLGGGNHFLETGVDESGNLWLLVHSGSRHTGLRIAGHYHDLAVAIKCARSLDTVDQLASLPIDDTVGQDYLHDMTWAADYARESRARMMRCLADALDVDFHTEAVIDTPHNRAWIDGDRVIHRKGATLASSGSLAVIPGSMGSASFIVRGKGNSESFESCSHGAGRRMSRKAAKTGITESAFAESLEGTYTRPSIHYIDEAPGAYKDIETVISRQSDLIDIVHRLRPIITVKGDSRARED